jgi:hypothetical protein
LNFVRGEILLDPNFVYRDGGEPCDKLLLVVNKKHQPKDDVILIPAKTNTSSYPYKANCNDDIKEFYIKDCIGFYKPNTIIQLNQIISWEFEQLKQLIDSGEIKKLTKTTTQNEINLIINCLKKIKDDISVRIHRLIF